MLIELENEPGNQVFYIEPRFADVDALDRAYSSREVVERSAMFSPSEIGPLTDDEYHRVAFSRYEDYGWFFSTPARIPIHHQAELFQRGFREAKANKFRELNAWLRQLAARMAAIRREYI